MTTSTKPLSSFRLLAFDIYGTLIDWDSGIYAACAPHLLAQLAKKLPKEEIISRFAIIEKHLQKEHPGMLYSTLLSEAYKKLAASLRVLEPTPHEAAGFAQSVSNWPAWPDTVAAMKTLSKHYKLVALSNIDRASFDQTLDRGLKGVKFDKVVIAEDVGAYKPDHRMFEALFKAAKEDFGIEKSEILHVAHGLMSDHVPAKELGLTSCWIERNGAEPGQLDELKHAMGYSWHVKTLADLAELVEKEK